MKFCFLDILCRLLYARISLISHGCAFCKESKLVSKRRAQSPFQVLRIHKNKVLDLTLNHSCIFSVHKCQGGKGKQSSPNSSVCQNYKLPYIANCITLYDCYSLCHYSLNAKSKSIFLIRFVWVNRICQQTIEWLQKVAHQIFSWSCHYKNRRH